MASTTPAMRLHVGRMMAIGGGEARNQQMPDDNILSLGVLRYCLSLEINPPTFARMINCTAATAALGRIRRISQWVFFKKLHSLQVSSVGAGGAQLLNTFGVFLRQMRPMPNTIKMYLKLIYL